MKLEDALHYLTDEDEQIRLSEAAGIETEKADSSALLAAYLLKPDVMKKRLLILHDDDIAFMRLVISRGTLVPVPANYDSADRIHLLGYGVILGDDMRFTIPDDAALVFKTIDTEEFNGERRNYSWIYDCMRLIPYLYGIIRKDDFYRLIKNHGYQYKKEETERIIDDLLQQSYCPVYFEDNLFINKRITKKEKIKSLLDVHADAAPAYPPYGERKDLLTAGYPSKEPSWQKLKQYLRRRWMETGMTEVILEAASLSIAGGADYTQTNASLKNQFSLFEDDSSEWKSLLSEAWLHTRMIMCNGHKPIEFGRDTIHIFLH